MQKTTIDTAHAEIARQIRLAKKRMFKAHREGKPLNAARDAFIAEVDEVITEQDFQLRGNPPKHERERRAQEVLGRYEPVSRERNDLADAVAEILTNDAAPPRLRDAVVEHVTDAPVHVSESAPDEPAEHETTTEPRYVQYEKTMRTLGLEVNQLCRDALRSVTGHFQRARQCDELLAKNRYVDPVAYALSALFVEISNEGKLDYATPGVASAFYRVAVEQARGITNPSRTLTTALRHLDILLETPNVKTANKLSKFWDARCSGDYSVKDPFPEKR